MTYPIFLCHGFARFDILLKADNDDTWDGLHYWRHIRGALQDAGFEVLHGSVDWAGPVEVRARQLADQIEAFLDDRPEGEKVNLIAHSMGAIIANEVIQRFQEIQIDNLVYMGAACSIRSFENIVIPYLEIHSDTKFYNLCLHPKLEAREKNILELAPGGSLL